MIVNQRRCHRVSRRVAQHDKSSLFTLNLLMKGASHFCLRHVHEETGSCHEVITEMTEVWLCVISTSSRLCSSRGPQQKLPCLFNNHRGCNKVCANTPLTSQRFLSTRPRGGKVMSQICRKQDIDSSWDTSEEKEMIKEFVKDIGKKKKTTKREDG